VTGSLTAGAAPLGQDDQGGGQRPGVVGRRRRVVGVQFHQPGYLRGRVPHERQEGKQLPGDPGQGHKPVVVPREVRPFVGEDGG
jgi:hypothetical protein